MSAYRFEIHVTGQDGDEDVFIVGGDMRVFSTFSGIGGFEVGIQNALNSRPTGSEEQDFKTNNDSTNSKSKHPRKLTVVGYSEIDKYAIKVYERQFPGVKNYGDITAIRPYDLPDFDCLVGGFPCQAFSIAGKRKGFDDTRGTLFFDLARILRAKQPRLFVFENVKGLLSHDNGQTFSTIISTLTELGYDCQWQVLNSKNHGVPQNRERVFIVGHIRGTARPKVFPIGVGHAENIGVCRYQANTLTARYFGAAARGTYIGVSGLIPHPQDGIDANGAGNRLDKNRRSMVKVGTLRDAKIRRLTPLECERLQGFPDNWTRYAPDGSEISDSQRYKMCGNAVTTNVVQAVFEKIFEMERCS